MFKGFLRRPPLSIKEKHKLRSSAIGIGGSAQGGPPRRPDTMAVVQGEAMSLDSLKKIKTNLSATHRVPKRFL